MTFTNGITQRFSSLMENIKLLLYSKTKSNLLLSDKIDFQEAVYDNQK